ncbi:MAG: hypothetical protein JW755_01125 [Candidatus Aminicenantes bacterium]|nr:hypothetical protein [Candidatus Aminicenantes bacterium]
MIENKEKTSRKRGRTKKEDLERDFELLTEKLKGKKPVPYSMSGSFEAYDVIDHDTFGKGIVIMTSLKKMDVVFSDKLRILACNK